MGGVDYITLHLTDAFIQSDYMLLLGECMLLRISKVLINPRLIKCNNDKLSHTVKSEKLRFISYDYIKDRDVSQ